MHTQYIAYAKRLDRQSLV